MKQAPTILLTNDDGWAAPGIRALYEALCHRGAVTVVAPETEQSGIGHAFTYHRSLTYRPLNKNCGLSGYAVAGTPSDCVKFALARLLPDPPDLVVSGLNAGENSGVAGHYSGTVAAAREGALWGIPSVALSVPLDGWDYRDIWARRAVSLLDMITDLHGNGFANPGNAVFFNVNFPTCAPDSCKGVRVTRQSLRFFDDQYREEGQEGPAVRYRLYGTRQEVESSLSFDSRAMTEGYIAITPLTVDATAHAALPALSRLEKEHPHPKEHD